ncbi:hypothetical protein ACMX2M_03870 [Paenibacillus polymyxa]
MKNIEVDNVFEFLEEVPLGDANILHRSISGRTHLYKKIIEIDEQFEISIGADLEIDLQYLHNIFRQRNPLFLVGAVSDEGRTF